MTTIDETCSCGAKFRLNGRDTLQASLAARSWRESHRHAEKVGICGNQAFEAISPTIGVPTCSLPDGHTGWHHDEHMGCDWGARPPTADRATETGNETSQEAK